VENKRLQSRPSKAAAAPSAPRVNPPKVVPPSRSAPPPGDESSRALKNRALTRSATAKIAKKSAWFVKNAQEALEAGEDDERSRRIQRERELERNRFINSPQKIPLPMISDRWKNVEKYFEEHWNRTGLSDTISYMKKGRKEGTALEKMLSSDPVEKAGQRLEDLKKRYSQAHERDYHRIIQALAGPNKAEGLWKKFWITSRTVRHPDWTRSKYTLDHFIEWWTQGPEVFYFNVVTKARVEHMRGPVEKRGAYEQLPADLKLLWNMEQFLKLRWGAGG